MDEEYVFSIIEPARSELRSWHRWCYWWTGYTGQSGTARFTRYCRCRSWCGWSTSCPARHCADTVCLWAKPLQLITNDSSVMLTPISEQPRSILPCLRSLRTWICPPSLIPATLLHSAIPTFISSTTPLFLRSYFRIDPVLTPTAYSVSTFLSSVLDLFTTLPFETVLRRGQIQAAIQAVSPSTSSKLSREQSRTRHRRRQSSTDEDSSSSQSLATVVDVGPYTGVISTLWRIVREEGETLEETGATTRGAVGTHAHRKVYNTKKGQGVPGLWRGWRVGMWGLIGVWGAAAMNGQTGKGGEF
jgi:fusion and transport protein UGO1